MTSYRPVDSKREEFRKYLEKSGVMDALTKALVLLYDEPEKPEDALEFVRKALGGKIPGQSEIDAMKSDLETALLKMQSLELENSKLKAKLASQAGEESTQDGADSQDQASTDQEAI